MACGLRRCRGKRGCICPKVPADRAYAGLGFASPPAEEVVEAVPVEAVEEDVARIFQFFDLDGNGKIDRRELTQVLQELDGTYWTLKRLRALFRAADVDRNQTISLKEFLDWIFVRGEEQHVLRTSVLEAAEARRTRNRSEHLTKLMAAQSFSAFIAAKADAEHFFSKEEMQSHERQFKSQMRSKHEIILVEARSLSTFRAAKKDAEQFFDADELRSYEEKFNIRRRSALEAEFVKAQSLSEFAAVKKLPDVDDLFTADELRDYVEQVKQGMRPKCKENLEAALAADLVSSLKEALRDARRCFESQDLQQYEENLAKLQLPFSVTVSTIAGSICSVEVERESSVKFLCSQVAKQLGIDPLLQDVLLVHSGGRLEPPTRTLEACGVTSSDVQLAAQLSLTPVGKQREEQALKEQRAAEELKKNAEERRTALHNNHLASFKALALDELLEQAKSVGLLKESEIIPGHEGPVLIQHLVHTHAIEDCKAEVSLLQSKCSDLESQIKQFEEASEHIEKVEMRSVADKALPVLAPAMAALDDVRKYDIDELKHIRLPPEGVKQTMKAMCLLLGIKAVRVKVDGRLHEDYWSSALQPLREPGLIMITRLKDYDKDNIDESVIGRMRDFIADETSTPEKLGTFNKFAAAVCMWARATYEYHQLTAPESKLLQERMASNLQLMNAAQEELETHQVRCQHVREDIAYFQKSLQAQAPLSKA